MFIAGDSRTPPLKTPIESALSWNGAGITLPSFPPKELFKRLTSNPALPLTISIDALASSVPTDSS